MSHENLKEVDHHHFTLSFVFLHHRTLKVHKSHLSGVKIRLSFFFFWTLLLFVHMVAQNCVIHVNEIHMLGMFRCVSRGNVGANHMREVCPTSGEFAGAVPARETLQQADVSLMFLLSCIHVVCVSHEQQVFKKSNRSDISSETPMLKLI